MFLVTFGFIAVRRIAEGQIFLGLAFLAVIVLLVAVIPLADLAYRRAPRGPQVLQFVIASASLLLVFAAVREWTSIV